MGTISKGILGRKVGMTQVFDEHSRVSPVTVVEAGPCRVCQVKTAASDGYDAIQIAFGEVAASKLPKAEAGHLAKAGVAPSRHLVELRLADPTGFGVGHEIRADIFAKGERADVVGISKGKGFAGVMKRHGFKGLGASHGTERKHRSSGSVGASASPSRVFKGVRMGGRMGASRTTVLNLEIVEADPERNLLLIRGAVPGPNGSLVLVRSSVKTRGRS